MRGGGARQRPELGDAIGVDAGVDDVVLAAGRQFEGQAAGMRGVGNVDRRRQAGVGNDGHAAHRQALIAGMRRMQQRRAGGVVVTQDGGDAVVDGGAHAVEAGKAAILMAEEAQRRQHAVDGADQGLRRRLGLVGIGLAQRQKVGEDFQHRHRIARNMAAIGKDLAVEFVGEVAGRAAQRRCRRRQRQGGEGQRDAGAQPVLAIRHFARHRPQIADLHGKRFQEGAVERELGALQHDRGMLQPGDDALGRGAGLPGDAGNVAAMHGDPVGDQGAGVGGGELGAGGAHVAQPAKAVQRLLPAVIGARSIWNGDLPPVSTRWPDRG